MSNNTICKFQYQYRKYQVDQLLDSLEGYSDFYFDIFDCTVNKEGVHVGTFNAHEGDDYKKLAIEELNSDCSEDVQENKDE